VRSGVEIVESSVVFAGLRFSVERRKYKFGDRVAVRDVVVFPNSVAVLPELDEDHVLLIKQYRPATGKFIYEVPAGVIEPGESAREAALRELEEELGYTAGELVEIGSFYTTPGYSTEKIHLFIARKLEYVGSRPELYEIIEPVVVPVRDLPMLIANNVIEDLKTAVIMLYYLALTRRMV